MLTKDNLGIFWKSNDGQAEVNGIGLYALFSSEISRKIEESIMNLWSAQNAKIKFSNIKYSNWNILVAELNVSQWPDDICWQQLLKATMQKLINAGAIVVWSGGEDCNWNPNILNPDSMMGNIYAGYSKKTGFLCNSNLSQNLEYLRDDQINDLRGELMFDSPEST